MDSRIRLRVRFGEVQHGWLGLELRCAGEPVLHEVVSAVPADSLWELAGALLTMRAGTHGATVRWHLELGEVEFCFQPVGDEVQLAVREAQEGYRSPDDPPPVEFRMTGSYEAMCVPFWRALRELQGRMPPEVFAARWGHAFPTQEVARLTEELQAARRGVSAAP